jgi:hypothetical protein
MRPPVSEQQGSTIVNNRLIVLLLSVTLVACTPVEQAIIGNVVGDNNSTSLVPKNSKCPQHYNTAIAAGWTADQWSKLDVIIWRESRCFSDVHNTKGRDNSYGLLQLNMKAHKKWVTPLVDGDFTRLFDPETNLRIGRVLYGKAKEAYGCGFQPWKTTKQKHWCN